MINIPSFNEYGIKMYLILMVTSFQEYYMVTWSTGLLVCQDIYSRNGDPSDYDW